MYVYSHSCIYIRQTLRKMTIDMVRLILILYIYIMYIYLHKHMCCICIHSCIYISNSLSVRLSVCLSVQLFIWANVIKLFTAVSYDFS